MPRLRQPGLGAGNGDLRRLDGPCAADSDRLNLVDFELAAQTSVFAPTVKRCGFINSNGVLLTLGT